MMTPEDVIHLADDVLCSMDIFEAVASSLSSKPGDGIDFWYDGGDDILCRTEAQASAMADWLDRYGYDAVTGYFDPAEDKQQNCVDEFTGWYYVTV